MDLDGDIGIAALLLHQGSSTENQSIVYSAAFLVFHSFYDFSKLVLDIMHFVYSFTGAAFARVANLMQFSAFSVRTVAVNAGRPRALVLSLVLALDR